MHTVGFRRRLSGHRRAMFSRTVDPPSPRPPPDPPSARQPSQQIAARMTIAPPAADSTAFPHDAPPPDAGGSDSVASGGIPGGSLASLIPPDDWRLYHLMLQLADADRARVIAFAELLYNLSQAKSWAADGALPSSAS